MRWERLPGGLVASMGGRRRSIFLFDCPSIQALAPFWCRLGGEVVIEPADLEGITFNTGFTGFGWILRNRIWAWNDIAGGAVCYDAEDRFLVMRMLGGYPVPASVLGWPCR